MAKIVLAGGTGFLGDYLAAHFSRQEYEVVIFSRKLRKNAPKNIRYAVWDGENLGDWAKELEGAKALINLAGRTVDCRYTEENKRQIMESRTHSTRVLGEAVAACVEPPEVWFNSSTATIYNHTELSQAANDEYSTNTGSDFSMTVAKEWERVLNEAPTPKTRKIALRISIALGKGGGAMVPLLRLAKLWFGGAQGGGQQAFSWVHIEDIARSIDFLMEHTELSGVFNIAQPHPISNAELMRALRRAVRRSWGLPMPRFLVKMGAVLIGTEAELILKSRNVVSRRLKEAGFQFKYDNINDALNEIVREEGQ